MGATDPVTTEIIRNALISAAREMNETLIRSAYSPSIYEMHDCSVGVFNARAEMLGQASGLPIFLGNLEETIKATTQRIGQDGYREGDAFIVNDSYIAGTHLGDITVFSPIFHEGRLVGFAATRAHWLDVGAKDPAVSVDSTEIYQEGIRIGPIRVADGGRILEDIVDILTRNSRFPDYVRGDLHAQIAACRTGERRFREIADRFGLPTVEEAVEEIFTQCEVLDREAVRSIPDGTYRAEGCLDDDGHVKGETVPVQVTIEVKGDTMTMDLTGSSPQRTGATNCGLAQAISACRVAFKFLVNPDFPATGGTFRNLDVVVPPRSIFSAEEPAACQWYYTALGLLIDLVVKALAPAMPRRTAAAHFGDSMVLWITGQHPVTQTRYLHAEITAGGWGASLDSDGESALVNAVNGEHRNMPVEVVEAKFPLFIHEYCYGQDTAGAGRHRGGLGVVRRYELLGEQAHLSTWFERSVTPAWGIFGGLSGSRPRVVVNAGTEDEQEILKVNFLPVERGCVFEARTGGGGGYGPPEERDPEAVLEDVREGFVSRGAAREVYKVALTDDLDIDVEGTCALRGESP